MDTSAKIIKTKINRNKTNTKQKKERKRDK